MTRIEAIAEWASALSWNDVSESVLDLCRGQRRSVLAAIAASCTSDAATSRVLDAVRGWSTAGPAPLLGRPGPSAHVEDAVFAAAAASIALDFDDYVCFGHTGHSAVLVPLMLAAETGGSGRDQLLAQVAANEVEARLGAACLIGPLNGQLWSFIHGAGAAVAASRMLGLDARRLAHALAIALYQPPRATVPGFMAPDSKLLTAAEPAVSGLRAARLAASGVTGPVDVLEHPQGFLAAFSDAPLPGMLGRLGSAWATSTLCVKPYPGCAYIDTVIDALMEMGPPPAGSVDRIVIEASMLTCRMESLSAGYATGSMPTPVTVTFSVPWNVAITLVAGELTPRAVNTEWLAAHREQLVDLVRRVSLRHDWELSRCVVEGFNGLLPPRRLVAEAGLRRLLRASRRRREQYPAAGTGLPSFALLRDALRAVQRMRRAGGPDGFWDPSALAGFAMTFPARVHVTLRDGTELVRRCDVPRGGAGHPTAGPEPVSREKLQAWGPCLWGSPGTQRIEAAIDADGDGLVELLGFSA